MAMTPLCPRCGRPSAGPEAQASGRSRCSCRGGPVAAIGADLADAYAPPRAEISPSRLASGGEGEWRLRMAVRRGPAGIYKGPLTATVGPGGLALFRGKDEVAWIGPGAGGRHSGGNLVAATIDGQDVTLAVIRLDVYQDRLARDLAAFLGGDRGCPAQADYAIPRPIVAIAMLPAAIGFVGMGGGAIGGGLGGAIGGGLVMANFAVARKERWHPVLRAGLGLAMTVAGGLLFAALFWAAVSGLDRASSPPPPLAIPGGR